MLRDFWQHHDDYGFHPEDAPHMPHEEVIDWELGEVPQQAAFDADVHLHRKIHRNLLPQPFAGNPCEASVVVLYGNPGFAISDYHHDHGNVHYANLCRMNLRGELDSFVWLHHDLANTGPGIYWRQTFRRLAMEISERTHEPIEAAFNRISGCVASVEAGAYHSRRLPAAWFFQLPSSQVARNFATDALLPRAQNGHCLVLVWRRAEFWGIQPALPNVIVRPRNRAQGRYLEGNEYEAILQRILPGA